MIGIVSTPEQLDVAREFFELFKTPWEPAVSGKRYRLVVATSDEVLNITAEVFIIYGARQSVFDQKAGVGIAQSVDSASIQWGNCVFPIYKGVVTYEPNSQKGNLTVHGKSIDYHYSIGDSLVQRVGYNLLDEVRYLLINGQPASNALAPTLELHIDFLRYLLIHSNVPFVEILPRPAGYDFICCLTHDVDFFGIRRHRFDRTMVGFLYRSSFGSLFDLLQGRRSFGEVVRNWSALCSLPFVFAGLLPDFWQPFEDYAKEESPGQSTFFLVPFKGVPGISPDGTINAWRATRYQIGDVQHEVRNAVCLGSELGLHGIDAWRDSDAGGREMREVTALTGSKTVGIRMHWLYSDESTPKRLEDAGFDYDSTCGYNEAVGYRAGTSQAFVPIGCTTLMELPMSIMDSALFSSGRLGLAPEKALRLSGKIIENAKHFGGMVVVNWHDRSLAPERLLRRFYHDLLEVVRKENRVWFAKCREAVEWFRWRRSISFYEDPSSRDCPSPNSRAAFGLAGSRSPYLQTWRKEGGCNRNRV